MTYRSASTGWLTQALLVGLLLTLSGCGNEYAEQIQQRQPQVKQRLSSLGEKLDSRQLVNAKIVEIYAQQLSQLKPEFAPVAEAMAYDVTREGSLYQGLLERFDKINGNPENKEQSDLANQALNSLEVGADPIVFNDALIDLVNTLAELSGGQLDTVSIPKDSNAAHARGEDVVPGSYLVGNPSYGEYRQDNSGRSFWHWYGQYAFFRSFFYNRPIYYNDWNSRSHYSYYRDYGRNAYGSRNDRYASTQRDKKMRQQGYTPAKPKKQYGSAQGRKRVSTYSQQQSRQGYGSGKKYGSSNNGARHADKDAAKRSSSFFGGNNETSSSNAAPKRSSSFFGGSSRSSYSRSSGGFGGK